MISNDASNMVMPVSPMGANNNSGYNSGYNYNRTPDWRSDSYSMADRYSMGNEAMINKLYDLMNQTHDEKTRHEFQNFINRMERM